MEELIEGGGDGIEIALGMEFADGRGGIAAD